MSDKLIAELARHLFEELAPDVLMDLFNLRASEWRVLRRKVIEILTGNVSQLTKRADEEGSEPDVK